MAKKKDYTDVLLEDINSKFEAVLEIVGSMQDNVGKIPKMAERLEKLEYDMATVKLATTATQRDTNLVKIRTEKLEHIQKEIHDIDERVKSLESVP